jgi:hypothetical protein
MGPSFRRKPESSRFKSIWTQAFAGVTGLGAYFDLVNIGILNFGHCDLFVICNLRFVICDLTMLNLLLPNLPPAKMSIT